MTGIKSLEMRLLYLGFLHNENLFTGKYGGKWRISEDGRKGREGRRDRAESERRDEGRYCGGEKQRAASLPFFVALALRRDALALSTTCIQSPNPLSPSPRPSTTSRPLQIPFYSQQQQSPCLLSSSPSPISPIIPSLIQCLSSISRLPKPHQNKANPSE